MLVPMVCAWIEQSHHTSSARIMGIHAITFVEIAVRAGIAKVIEMGLASKHLRHNVVNVERLGSDDLRCVAIFTTIARTLCHPTRQGQGEVRHKVIAAQEPLDWRRKRAVRRAALVRRAWLIRPEASTRSGRVARRRASVFWSRRFLYWATRSWSSSRSAGVRHPSLFWSSSQSSRAWLSTSSRCSLTDMVVYLIELGIVSSFRASCPNYIEGRQVCQMTKKSGNVWC